jgi:tRNA (guanine37-N1)-methyltransferase
MSVRIDVITLFPDFVRSVVEYGVIRKAVDAGTLHLACWNPRDETQDRHQSVDDRPYGGGPGMVMRYQPLRDSLARIKQELGTPPKVVLLSPQGRKFDQSVAAERVEAGEPLVLVAGRYEGIDERFVGRWVDEEWSVGDFVLSGGELAAMIVIDVVARLLPGTLGDPESALQDSFQDGLLDCPHYTRPEVVDDLPVPEVLMSGNHSDISRWRKKMSLGRTHQRRPDLLEQRALDDEEQCLLNEYLLENRF